MVLEALLRVLFFIDALRKRYYELQISELRMKGETFLKKKYKENRRVTEISIKFQKQSTQYLLPFTLYLLPSTSYL